MAKFRRSTQEERKAAFTNRSNRGVSFLNTDLPLYSPKEGENCIRILPPRADDPDSMMLGVSIWMTYYNKQGYLSPATLNRHSKDPFREAYTEFKRQNDPRADGMKPVRRTVMFILDLKDSETVKVWVVPNGVMESVISLARNRGTGEILPIDDAEIGRAIFFDRIGSGLSTKYSGYSLDEDAYPIEEYLSESIPLYADILNIPSPEQIEKVLGNVKAAPREEAQPKTRQQALRSSSSVGVKSSGYSTSRWKT